MGVKYKCRHCGVLFHDKPDQFGSCPVCGEEGARHPKNWEEQPSWWTKLRGA